MEACISRQGYVVSKTSLSTEELVKVRKELTVRADWDPVTSYGPAPQKFPVFLEDEANLCVPTHWGHKNFAFPTTEKFRAEICPRLEFRGILNSELQQPLAAEECMKAFKSTGGGILALPTGTGKTTVALSLACQLRLKTLVVVNSRVLMEQWKQRINTFVPNAQVGIIQGPCCDSAGKDIVVAMLQSLSQREYDMKGFGFCVVDECNHIAAPTFSQAMLRINCRYKLGLSATPERKDGLTKVLVWFLGPIFLTLKRRDQHRVIVEVLQFDCSEYRCPPPTRHGRLSFESVLETVCDSMDRNNLMCQKISTLLPGRKVLVLSARREHCMNLCGMLSRVGVNAAAYLGGMSSKDLAAASDADVIVGTYSIAAEGLDIPALNTLVLATPKRDVIQACGRIIRGVSSGIRPMVVDIRDAWGCLLGQFYARRAFYKESGYDLGEDQSSLCGFLS